MTLFITRGLPGSGKSTAAENWREIEIRNGRNAVVIGRDHIRLDILRLGTTLGTKDQEELVTKMQRQMVQEALLLGWDVCVDDTNLPQKRAKDWADLAVRCRHTYTVVDYTKVPLDVCISNDEQRIGTSKYVGADVIREMHKKYLASGKFVADVEVAEIVEPPKYEPNDILPPAFVFDIDGTCALMTGRSPYEWQRVLEDDANHWVREIAWALFDAGFKIVYLSGRDGACEGLTRQWLNKHEFPQGELFMRTAGDHRKDSIIKPELFFKHVAPAYHVLGCFDDRNQVVDMWREIGVKCAQVAPGEF